MENRIIIRPETRADYHQTEHMVMRAFWNIHGPGCNEHLLVRIIRSSPDFLPALSRVAELDGRIVGAIYYTRARVVDGDTVHDVVTFGPLAVEPTLQNVGIGRLLLEETLPLARASGYPGVIIYGEPAYYPKRGFRTCDHFGITTPDGQNFDALMAYPLDEAAFSLVHGRLFESTSFKACENADALAAINAEFPAYPLIKIQEGFLQIYDCRFGTITTASGLDYTVACWEQTFPAIAGSNLVVLPKPGDIVLFRLGNDGIAVIASVCKNLL